MSVIVVVVGIIAGTAVAWVLNKTQAGGIENKNYRRGLKITAYIACVIFGAGFAMLCSLRTLADNFINDRIEFIKTELFEIFPDSNILELGIATGEFPSVIPEVLRLVNDVDTSGNGVFEGLVFDAFSNTLTGYAHTIEGGIARMNLLADDNGQVTIDSLLYGLKDMALEAISPYFVFGQIGIVFLLLVFIGIYIGVTIFLKKGGAMYNKSIVFGDSAHDKSPEGDRTIDP
jgi:hypothetical protein